MSTRATNPSGIRTRTAAAGESTAAREHRAAAAEPFDIRVVQDPLRERYRVAPEEARIVDRGRTESWNLGDPIHVRGVPGSREYGVAWELGIHRAVGGLHDLPNPGDLLALALATCMDTVVRMVANRHGVTLRHLAVDVRGEVDVRGTLWVSQEVPVGFQRMRCSIDLEAEEGTDPALVQRLVIAAERSCVNLQTLRHGVPVEVSLTSS